jgi:hypothetical protein
MRPAWFLGFLLMGVVQLIFGTMPGGITLALSSQLSAIQDHPYADPGGVADNMEEEQEQDDSAAGFQEGTLPLRHFLILRWFPSGLPMPLQFLSGPFRPPRLLP